MTGPALVLTSLAQSFRDQLSPYSGEYAAAGIESGEFTAEQAAALDEPGRALVSALADFIDAAAAAEAFDQPLAFAEGLADTLARAEQVGRLSALLGGLADAAGLHG